MGFTIEDMLVVSSSRYQMRLEAGKNGWSNSISWLLMLEDMTITQNFSGKELAVTTGLGFPKPEDLLDLARQLVHMHASGLLINTGRYVLDIPKELAAYCNENDFPLLTVPWDVVLADMIKDLSIRIFLQGDTDTQISEALIQAIEEPGARDYYVKHLLPHFDVDGSFQVILLGLPDLDKMDTVDRRRLSYRMQLYLTNITHNGHFFYYDGVFVLMINDVKEAEVKEIIQRFERNLRKRMPDSPVTIGISDVVMDLSRLQIAYQRAKAALSMAENMGKGLQYFSEMGLYRLLYLVPDRDLLQSMSSDLLHPLLEHDRLNASCYVATLDAYLKADGSIQAVSEALFTHRNTVMYRMNKIRLLLGCQLDTQEEKMMYRIACLIHSMNL